MGGGGGGGGAIGLLRDAGNDWKASFLAPVTREGWG